MAALRSTLGASSRTEALNHPHVSRLLKGVSRVNPPQVHHFPSWGLPLVLSFLSEAPFEPLFSSDLRSHLQNHISGGITSARRVWETGALSVNPNLCIFHAPRSCFHPKGQFLAQELTVPTFCPKPKGKQEIKWRKSGARRAVKHYLERTRSFRKTVSSFRFKDRLWESGHLEAGSQNGQRGL